MTLQIGSLKLWSPVILAPMAGVTNAPFRRLCREYGELGLRRAEADAPEPFAGASDLPEGDATFARQARSASNQEADSDRFRQAQAGVDAPAGLYVSEMVTSRALIERTPETMRMVRPDPLERVRSVQLYGVDPATMAAAAAQLVADDLVDHIDMNFGCPVPKVTRKGGGAALPWKSELFEAIVKQVVRAAGDVPVTVKMRVGIDEDHVTFMDAGRMAQDAGAAAVALHARTAAQHYSGQAHWEQIAHLKDALDVPVLGNGDVFEAEDALAMMCETGCDGVVVGRGCQGRPWLFADLTAALAGSDFRVRPTLGEVAQVILRHADLMVENFGDEDRAMREMRKHIGWYMRGYAIGGPHRRDLNLVSSRDELRSRLSELDLEQTYPPSAMGKRGRAGGVKRPHLPEGWLDSRELSDAERERLMEAEVDTSGG